MSLNVRITEANDTLRLLLIRRTTNKRGRLYAEKFAQEMPPPSIADPVPKDPGVTASEAHSQSKLLTRNQLARDAVLCTVAG